MTETEQVILLLALLFLMVVTAIFIGKKFTSPVPRQLPNAASKPLRVRIVANVALVVAAPFAFVMLVFVAFALFMTPSGGVTSYTQIAAGVLLLIGLPLLIIGLIRLARRANRR